MKDGLSQEDRQQRIHSVKPFTVVDDLPETLLKRAGMIAASIRFYDLEGRHDGFFDEAIRLFNEPGTNNVNGGEETGTSGSGENAGGYGFDEDVVTNDPDSDGVGNMEPSKALLLAFIRQLSGITGAFNKKWERYISWYLNDVLKVSATPACPDSAWVSLTKNIPKNVFLKKGTPFTFDGADDEQKVLFHTTEPVLITNAWVEKAYSLHFDKNPDVYPASLFKIPTALKVKDLLSKRDTKELLFDERVNPSESFPVGLCISSPVFLLREGKRFVTMEFEAEQVAGTGSLQHRRHLVKLLQQICNGAAPISRKDAKEVLFVKVFSDIFYIEISTSDGWKAVDKYVVKGVADVSDNYRRKLSLTFELQDDFPETQPCDMKRHRYESYYPAVKIVLNRDAWLYPYAWLKDFMVAKVNIEVEVDGVSNVLFYNELGKIDNAMPFAPFGNNTEQGAWFVTGNYEMSMKKIESMSLHINWQQLPSRDGGLGLHYEGYDEQVDNCSFQVKARYLSDYKWKETDNQEALYLFSSGVKDRNGHPLPQNRLSDESVLPDIRFKEMKPVFVTEDEYDYNIRTKSGFFNFVLTSPEMGFGEKAYRRLYSDHLINQSLRKKKHLRLYPPITPLIERLTLSYKATEQVDFRTFRKEGRTVVSHVYPFGIRQIYPAAENNPVPFVFSLDTDANILFGLKEVRGDEFIHLFIDFFPQKKEVQLSELPRVRWYWGDGYQWSVLPDDSVRKDTTRHLLTSGIIRIYLPEVPYNGVRDKDGIVWLRAGVTENGKSISEVNRICTNTVRVFRDVGQMDVTLPEGFVLNTPEPGIPGIASVEQVTPIHTGLPAEDDTCKRMRVSEFVSHRNKAVTARDYERMTLQAFPQVGKVKCLSHTNTKEDGLTSPGVVSLVIIPAERGKKKYYRPYVSPELLLEIENYFSSRISPHVTNIDAINPVYEEIIVRCTIDFHPSEKSNAFLRAAVRKVIDTIIAPWQQEKSLPVLGYSFDISLLHEKINSLAFVKNIGHLSAVHLIRTDGCAKYKIKEYSGTECIVPSRPHAVLVPFENHIIKSGINEAFGIDEMGINENFIIWQNETGKP